MVKVICIKTCISDKYHIAYENSFYFIYEKVESSFRLISLGLFEKIFTKYHSLYSKEQFYPICELCVEEKNSLGNFDKRNFLKLAEYRNLQIEDILTETEIKLLN